jgi:precorrin-2 methylase
MMDALLEPAPPYDLACVGTSIHGLGAFSLEGVACLKCADVVYYYPPSQNHLRFMKRINKNIVDVNATIYVKGKPFEPTYDAIVEEVMGALERGKRVAYAVQGSPAFHCGTAVPLHRRATRQGYTTLVVPGISSFELLSAELSKRYDLRSVQLYDVRRVAEGELSIETRSPCLLFDLGRFALPAIRESASTFMQAKLAALADRLRATYPSDHLIFIMQVAITGECRSIKTTPRELEISLTKLGAGVTLFLPAVSPPS